MSVDIQPAAQAVEALIHQYGRLVFQVIYRLTGDWHESQDLTQDTFVTAFKAIEAARQASGANFHAKAWLMQFLLVGVNIQTCPPFERKIGPLICPS
jgi:DNA-directed RNA polymerase specialized sigma24 family protein